MATEAEQAWAAGVFEGEGTIVTFGPTKRQRSLSVSMTDEDVIRRFAAVVGVGKIYGPYGYANGKSRRREHHKQYWRWTAATKHSVLAAAQMFLPWMGQRRAQKLNEAIEAVKQLRVRVGWSECE